MISKNRYFLKDLIFYTISYQYKIGIHWNCSKFIRLDLNYMQTVEPKEFWVKCRFYTHNTLEVKYIKKNYRKFAIDRPGGEQFSAENNFWTTHLRITIWHSDIKMSILSKTIILLLINVLFRSYVQLKIAPGLSIANLRYLMHNWVVKIWTLFCFSKN